MIKEYIGEPAMYELLAEECTELAHAALKMARIRRGENPTPNTETEIRGALIEETTDVNICLQELNLAPDEVIKMKKYNRFKQRLDKGMNYV